MKELENSIKVLQSKDSESYFEIMKQSIKMQAQMEYMSKQEVDDLYKETNLSNIKTLSFGGL